MSSNPCSRDVPRIRKLLRLSRRETSFSGRGDFTDASQKLEERSPNGRPTSIRTLAGPYSQETQKPVTTIPLDVRHVNPNHLYGVTKIEQDVTKLNNLICGIGRS